MDEHLAEELVCNQKFTLNGFLGKYFLFPSHDDASRHPISLALGVEADGWQHLQEAPVGLNLTACLHEGSVMRKTVFILPTCVRMTHTQVFSEHVYTVVVLKQV